MFAVNHDALLESPARRLVQVLDRLLLLAAGQRLALFAELAEQLGLVLLESGVELPKLPALHLLSGSPEELVELHDLSLDMRVLPKPLKLELLDELALLHRVTLSKPGTVVVPIRSCAAVQREKAVA
jgi:hypothetical protein